MPLASLLLLAAVPDVVLTTDQAARLTPRRLEQLLLAGFPHGPIDRVEQPSTVRTRQPAAVPFEQPLNSIIFHERPRAAGGAFCSVRRIYAKFTTLDRGVTDAPGFAPGATPRRLFAVNAAPLLGIIDRPANDAVCAAATVKTQLPLLDPARGRRVVEQWLGLQHRSAAGASTVPLTCVNAYVWPEQACDGAAELAAIPPGALLNVDLPSAVRGPTTQLRFDDGRRHWTADLTGDDRVTAVTIRRAPPPPF